MKYKLIKEYPGSPELGTMVEGDNKCNFSYSRNSRQLCVLNSHVENNPEYWEKVEENIWWVVFTKEDTIFESYYPYCLETSVFKTQDSRQYFKTKKEAEEFVIDNKPCLSYADVMWNFQENTKKNIVSIHKDMLIALIKSKL